MESDKIEHLKKILSRQAAFYLLYPDSIKDFKIKCRTSSSSIYLYLSRKNNFLIWDERLIEFLNHAFWGIIRFNDILEINDHKTKGELHLKSVILFRLAEKVISPNLSDFLFANGLLFLDESVYFRYSVPILATHSNGVDVIDKWCLNLANLFEDFILEHELAHNTFKTQNKKEYATENYLNKVIVSKKIIDQKYNELKNGSHTINKEILLMYEGVDTIFANRALLEEVFADTYAIENILNEPNEAIPKSVLIYIYAQSILTGITAMRLLGLSEIIIKAKDNDEFESLFMSHKYFYNTRKLFIENVLKAHIIANPITIEPTENGDIEFNRIDSLSLNLHKITLAIEYEMEDKFLKGHFREIREEAKCWQIKHSLSEEELVGLCADKLGWLQFFQ